MKKIILSSVITFVFLISLTAQITRDQADVIVFQHIKNEITSQYELYVYNHIPSNKEILISTINDEKIKIKYACWAYYLNENPEITTPCRHRYIFVKEDNGNILEIITLNDLVPENLTEWRLVLGVTDRATEQNILIYPNPTTGEFHVQSLKFEVQGVEIYDIYGKKINAEGRMQKAESNFNNLTVLRSYDLTVFPAGVYFLKITTDQGVVTEKIIKY